MARPAHIHVDTSAMQYNLAHIKKLAPHSKILAMVKANAYGHGIDVVSAALHNIDGFGVASLEEAEYIRSLGYSKTIVLMSGVNQASDLHFASELGISVMVHCKEQCYMLENVHDLVKPLSIWMKINTGMNRLGFAPSEVDNIYQRLRVCNIQEPIVACTHLANAQDKDFSVSQLHSFDQTVDHLPVLHSIANSGGILLGGNFHRDWIRPGGMIYGISPLQNKTGADLGLIPAMNFSSKVIAIQDCKQGQHISYGDFTATKDTKIAIIAAGYGDGYPRHAAPGTPVLINGKHCSLVGAVTMDMLMVDISHCGDINIGDDVLLWGKALPVEDIASFCNTTAYELTTCITSRVQRTSETITPEFTAELAEQ